MGETNLICVDRIIIVDSTRRGKRKSNSSPILKSNQLTLLIPGMPDALSTTIPIWCTVLNQALLPDHPLSKYLFLPPSHSASTHAQISALIPEFLSSLHALRLANLPTDVLTKPLRPFWLTQDSIDESIVRESGDVFEDYRSVICCTASRRVVGVGSEVDEGGYIQGAADDTENWAHGLTSDVFWKHIDELLAAGEDDLPRLISRLVEKHKVETQSTANDSRVRLTPYISVCALPILHSTEEICIALMPQATNKDTWKKSRTCLEVGLGQGKTASRNLRTALPHIRDFVSHNPDIQAGSPTQIVLACESGKDLSMGAALALSCSLFDDQGQLRTSDQGAQITKSLIKRRLGTIMMAYPSGNPSRNTLQSVNSFLIDW